MTFEEQKTKMLKDKEAAKIAPAPTFEEQKAEMLKAKEAAKITPVTPAPVATTPETEIKRDSWGEPIKTAPAPEVTPPTPTPVEVTAPAPVPEPAKVEAPEPVKVEEVKAEVETPEQEEIRKQKIEQNKLNADPNYLFTQIQTGAIIAPKIKTSPAYAQANKRFSDLGKFQTMTEQDLATSMSDGNLLPGSQVYNDLKQTNPALVAEAEKLNSLNSAITGVKKTNEDVLTTISSKLLELYTGNTDDYKTALSENPEVVKLNETMLSKKTELDELKDQIDNLGKDVETRLEGTGATKGYANALASRENADLVRAYNLKLNEYSNLAGTLERISEDVKYEMGLQQAADTKQIQALQFMYGIAKDEQDYERQLDLQAGLNSEDPRIQDMAIRDAVDTMVAAYPIVGMESAIVKTQKVKTLMEQGKTPEEALMIVEQEIRASDKYKDLLASERAELLKDVPAPAPNIVQTNPQSIIDYATSNRGTETLQCGELVNDYVKMQTGIKGIAGDTFDTKVNAINSIGASETPIVGGIFAFDTSDGVGHTGIVQNVNLDGSITTLDANKAGRTEGDAPKLETYSADQVANMSFSKSVGGPAPTRYSADAEGIMSGVGELSDFTPTERAKILPELRSFIAENETDDSDRNLILKSALRSKDPSETTLVKMQDMETVKFQLAGLEDRLAGMKTGPFVGLIEKFNPYDTDAQVALAQLAGLTPKVARGIFGEVGVLTDTDIENYQRALPNLTSTKEKNTLVIDFMKKLLSEGYKNAIVTQAKGGRNVSNFLEDYDEMTFQAGFGATQNAEFDLFDQLYGI